MNNKFDELAKGLARSDKRRKTFRSGTNRLFYVVLGAAFATAVLANDFKRGPLLDLSDPDILAACGSNGTEMECPVAVNPTNPKNLVTVWIGGWFKGITAAVSLDGGKRWQQVAIPGLSICSTAPMAFEFSFDPWLSFAPNGDLHLVCGALTLNPWRAAMLASKSTDGGLHWSTPVALADTIDSRFGPDHPSITADPTDARFVYAMWDGSDLGHRGPAIFARTTDGGRTWEPGRAIVRTDPQDYVQFSQVFVLPDGTLVNLYELVKVKDSGHGIQQDLSLQVVRSADRGQTWSGPLSVTTMLPLYGGPNGNSQVTDPDTGYLVQDPLNPSFAVDRRNGALYAVWEDGRFSNFQYNDIAFAMSADGGATWSPPVRVNQTPLNVVPANRQAFLPSVAVAADGTIGVGYYDFRLNDPNPGALTDYWLVHCHHSATTPASSAANWGNELRLTAASFDIETAPDPFGIGYFVGDYEGLATVGNDFLAAWTQPHGTDLNSIFFRRVGP